MRILIQDPDLISSSRVAQRVHFFGHQQPLTAAPAKQFHPIYTPLPVISPGQIAENFLLFVISSYHYITYAEVSSLYLIALYHYINLSHTRTFCPAIR